MGGDQTTSPERAVEWEHWGLSNLAIAMNRFWDTEIEITADDFYALNKSGWLIESRVMN